MLVSTFRLLLRPAQCATDRTIDFVIGLIDAYEHVASRLESVMRALCSELAGSGRAAKSDVLRRKSSRLEAIREALHDAAEEFQLRLLELVDYPDVRDRLNVDRFSQLLEDARAGAASDAELVNRVLDRHARVQRQKKKGVWIDVDGEHWTLMPGFGNVDDERPSTDEGYLHPFRVANAYSFLADLHMVPAVEDFDGEEA
jgi:hypothetical protein